MMKYNIRVWILLAVFMLCGTVTLAEQDTNWNKRFWLEFSYQVPANDGFREFYGESFAGAGRYEFEFKDRLWLGFRLGFDPNTFEFNDKLKFKDYFLSGIARYDLTPGWEYGSVLAGAGLQLDYRRISMTLPYQRYDASPPGDTTVAQDGLDPSLLLDCAFTYNLSQSWLIALQLNYNYFPFGEPERGDFGNTGGLSISGALGIAF